MQSVHGVFAGGFAVAAMLALGAGAMAAEPDQPKFYMVETDIGVIADNPEADNCYEYVSMTTSMGTFIIELHRCAAPKTVDNFLQYVDGGFYDDTIFHRVLNKFVIQGGGYDLESNEKETMQTIPSEWPNGLKNKKYTIAMVRENENPDSGTSQFFINLKDSADLDRPSKGGAGYCVFGRVIEGTDVVDRIGLVPTIRKPAINVDQGPIDDIPVISVGRVPTEEAAALAAKHAEDRLEFAGAFFGERFQHRWKLEEREKNKQMNEDQRVAQAIDYVKRCGWDVTKGVKLPTGVWYIDDRVGVGDMPGPNDYVAMKWDGWLSWGEKFGAWDDNGKQEVLRGEVSGFVPGYREALRTMKPGGVRVIVIPSHLAYGEFGREPKIPANSALVYRVELLGVLPATEEVPVPKKQPGTG